LRFLFFVFFSSLHRTVEQVSYFFGGKILSDPRCTAVEKHPGDWRLLYIHLSRPFIPSCGNVSRLLSSSFS